MQNVQHFYFPQSILCIWANNIILFTSLVRWQLLFFSLSEIIVTSVNKKSCLYALHCRKNILIIMYIRFQPALHCTLTIRYVFVLFCQLFTLINMPQFLSLYTLNFQNWYRSLIRNRWIDTHYFQNVSFPLFMPKFSTWMHWIT